MKYQTEQLNTCSKLTIETLDEVWNMFEVNNKDTKAMTLFCSRVDRSKTPVPSKHLLVQSKQQRH